jgi:hypothetical protein
MFKIRGVIVQVKTCCYLTSMTKATYCNIWNVKSTLADAIDSGRELSGSEGQERQPTGCADKKQAL